MQIRRIFQNLRSLFLVTDTYTWKKSRYILSNIHDIIEGPMVITHQFSFLVSLEFEFDQNREERVWRQPDNAERLRHI